MATVRNSQYVTLLDIHLMRAGVHNGRNVVKTTTTEVKDIVRI